MWSIYSSVWHFYRLSSYHSLFNININHILLIRFWPNANTWGSLYNPRQKLQTITQLRVHFISLITTESSPSCSWIAWCSKELRINACDLWHSLLHPGNMNRPLGIAAIIVGRALNKKNPVFKCEVVYANSIYHL